MMMAVLREPFLAFYKYSPFFITLKLHVNVMGLSASSMILKKSLASICLHKIRQKKTEADADELHQCIHLSVFYRKYLYLCMKVSLIQGRPTFFSCNQYLFILICSCKDSRVIFFIANKLSAPHVLHAKHLSTFKPKLLIKY